MAWIDHALSKIKNNCCATTPEKLLKEFVNNISNYDPKMNYARVGLVFVRMLTSIEYSTNTNMYIVRVDRERLDKFVEL